MESGQSFEYPAFESKQKMPDGVDSRFVNVVFFQRDPTIYNFTSNFSSKSS